MSDAQLAAVSARATVSNDALPPLPLGLSPLLKPGSASSSRIDAQQFAADMRARGVAPFAAPLYDGREVVKTVFDATPFDAQIDLAQLLVPVSSVAQHVSLGTIQIHQINASGTTLWVWTH